MFGKDDSPPLPSIGAAPPPPPMFGAQPSQKKPQQKSMQPSFLGNGVVPTGQQLGTKTLLGA